MNSPHKLALVVPYRDREPQLRQFLPHIKRYLQQQQIDYHVYIVEQEAGMPFNKGVLMNAGYREADADRDYFVFHDVDQLPQQVDYGYQPLPTHLAAAVSQFNYQLPYETLFGGAVLFNRGAFEQVNGYSNHYWGWGGEDDDMICRCRFAHLDVQRQSTGTFLSLDHDRTRDRELYAGNVNRLKDMHDGRVDWRSDGLNSCCYRVSSKESSEDQTWIRVSLPDTTRSWSPSCCDRRASPFSICHGSTSTPPTAETPSSRRISTNIGRPPPPGSPVRGTTPS